MLVAVVFRVGKDICGSIGIKKVLDVLRQAKAGQAHKGHPIAQLNKLRRFCTQLKNLLQGHF
jgi:hypothetical protein